MLDRHPERDKPIAVGRLEAENAACPLHVVKLRGVRVSQVEGYVHR